MSKNITRLGASVFMGCLFALLAQTALPDLFGGKFFLIAGIVSLGIFALNTGLDSDPLRHQ